MEQNAYAHEAQETPSQPKKLTRVVVVGAGMHGARFADQLAGHADEFDITLIGDEPLYDRPGLISVLDGSKLPENLDLPCAHRVLRGLATSIDRGKRNIMVKTTRAEVHVPYDKLVIATGARAYMPPIPGIEHAFAARTLDDVHNILMVSRYARHIAVVGGGVLGVEVAHALRLAGSPVSIVHHGKRLMERHIDSEGAVKLQSDLQNEGIAVHLNMVVTAIEKHGIEANGTWLDADLVVVCAGVVPNDWLAAAAGLECKAGVVVDDAMRTSDPDILAVGDCTRHNGKSYCLVQSGYEQAAIAARVVAGLEYSGFSPTLQTRIKTRHKAFSFGVLEGKSCLFKTGHLFRKVWFDEAGRLVGAVVFGSWESIPRLCAIAASGDKMSWWRRLWFCYSGEFWPFTAEDPANWPDDAVVCRCHAVTRGQVTGCLSSMGAPATVEAVAACTNAGRGCGSCKPLVAQILRNAPGPVPYAMVLDSAAMVVACIVLFMAASAIPYQVSFTSEWGAIWRNDLYMQASGYVAMAFGALLAVLGIRKRARKLGGAGNIATWRMAHAILGLLSIIGLLAHTGGHLGAGLVWLLSVSWLAACLMGAVYAMLYAWQHKHPTFRFANFMTPLHVAAISPLPLLMVAHIAQVYLWR